MHTPPTSSKPEIVRLTIPVSREVHDTFTRLAKASSMSTGRAMAEWLGDTLDAATFMAHTMERAREAPKLVARELHAYALGLGDESTDLIEKLRAKGAADRAAGAGAASTVARSARTTPPSNTGVTTVTNKPNAPKRGKK